MAGFFATPRVRVGGYAWSLDDVEHGVLRSAPKYGRLRAPIAGSDPRLAFVPPAYDERVHFGMYSACRSSPALRVFHGEALDVALEAAAREYVNRSVRVLAEGAILRVPKIFQWYAGDFGGQAGVLEFVIARMEDEAAVDAIDRRQGRVHLEYASYDWGLNAAPERRSA